MILSNNAGAAVDPTEAEVEVNDGPTNPAPAIFTFPNRILFGEGSLRSLPAELARLGIERPLLVVDAAPAVSELAARLASSLDDFVPFDGAGPNPTEVEVLEGLDRYRSTGRDGVVALGGGSAIDAAKAIRLLAAQPGALAGLDSSPRRENPRRRGGGALPPMIAAPTTAGTGAEVASTALIRLAATGRKTAVSHPGLLPEVAICDPKTTATLPPPLTAGAGVTALAHCLESFLATPFHPICDGLAIEGLRAVFRGLETAVRDGADAAARSSMMTGALLGGAAAHKGIGVVGTLADALAGEARVHHGAFVAILLAHGLRFNRVAAEPRMIELASRLGLGRAGDGAGHLVTLVELSMARMPLPRKLGQVDGLRRDRIPELARAAMLDPRLAANPRPCSAGLLEELLDRAW